MRSQVKYSFIRTFPVTEEGFTTKKTKGLKRYVKQKNSLTGLFGDDSAWE